MLVLPWNFSFLFPVLPLLLCTDTTRHVNSSEVRSVEEGWICLSVLSVFWARYLFQWKLSWLNFEWNSIDYPAVELSGHILSPVFRKWRMSTQCSWYSASLVIHLQEWLFCFSWVFLIIITWVLEVGKDQFYHHTPSFELLVTHIWDWFVCFSWRVCMHCHLPGRHIINHCSDTLGWHWYILEAIQMLIFSLK